MAHIELGGLPVETGRISMLLAGRWNFEGRVTTQVLPVGAVDLVCEGGLRLSGFVDPATSGLFLDSADVTVVGGAGGLARPVSGTFQFAQLRDPLQAILDASGEKLSASVSSALLSVQLRRWQIIQSTCGAALFALAGAASEALGQTIRWRVLPDGTLWLGAETWPAQALADGDALEWLYPTERRAIVQVATPTIAPGVAVPDIGNVGAVEHIIEHAKVRTWLTTVA